MIRTVAALAALALTAAACTSSGEDAADNPVVTNSPSTSITELSPPTSSPPTSAPPTTPSSSATPSTSSSAPPANPSDACTATQLKTTLLRGGAELGKQYAAVLFTNTSQQSCTLQGYPFAQLVRGGKLIGQPATHSAGRSVLVRLKPGGSAQADVVAVSSCNAALSDHVSVGAPGLAARSALPDTLRNCGLSIGPVHRA